MWQDVACLANIEQDSLTADVCQVAIVRNMYRQGRTNAVGSILRMRRW